MSLPWYLLYYTPDENGIVVGKMWTALMSVVPSIKEVSWFWGNDILILNNHRPGNIRHVPWFQILDFLVLHHLVERLLLAIIQFSLLIL
jgi:hypothetical protein